MRMEEVTKAMAFLLGVLVCLVGLALNYMFFVNTPLRSLQTVPYMDVTVGNIEFHHFLYTVLTFLGSALLSISEDEMLKKIGAFFFGVAFMLLVHDIVIIPQMGVFFCIG